jgi:Carboxypeptidase regulatory-like domain
MNRSHAPVLVLSAIVVIIGACASGAGATSPATPATSPSAAPSAPAPSPSIALPISTPDAAAALVIASDSRFAGIGKRDPNMIGACCWYSATAAGDGSFQVTIEIGWGDCPSGCIEKHDWMYTVAAHGTVKLDRETGPAVPPGSDGGGGTGTATGDGGMPAGPGIAGQALAGPTCPVVTPGDPGCNDRPVNGATILIRDANGTVVAELTTDATGHFQVVLPPGTYRIEPQPVEGFMGTASAIDVTVGGSFQVVQISYDTGIR